MTKLLEQAMQLVSELPDEEQDAVAAIVLAELGSGGCWDDLFADSQEMLAELAGEVAGLDDDGETTASEFDHR